MSLVVVCSSRPGSQVHIEPPVDKIVHAAVFGILAYFLALGTGERSRRHGWWLVPLLVTLFGFTDEIHQSFVPGRSVSAGDIGADFTGAAMATLFWWLARRQGRCEAAPAPLP